MKFTVIANTSPRSESFGFIRPIADCKNVESILVCGEGSLTSYKKVIYITDGAIKNKLLRLIHRTLNVIVKSRKSDYIIGIYEIPHGLIAYVSAWVLGKKSILCIIGNPSYSKLRKGLRLWIMNVMINRMSYTTVTGSNSRRHLEKKGFDVNKIEILPNSIDTEVFRNNHSKKEYDIISLGRLSPEKELINLLKIVILIKKNKSNVQVAIAGSGPERERLETYITENGLEENVKLIGYIDDKIDFYNKGCIFLLTSRTEGLPRTVIESMSCGTPCIVSRVGDIEDLVINNQNGYLIDNCNDLVVFAEKVYSLLNDEVKIQKFSENARKIVEKKFSHNAATRFWEKLLAHIN